jgi:ribosomal protein L32
MKLNVDETCNIPVHKACPVCGSSQLRHRFCVDGFDISRCSSCALQFVLQQLTDKELAPFYQISDSVYEESSNIENLAYYLSLFKASPRSTIPSRRTTIRCGCSRGQFLDVMAGWDTYGIELSTTDAGFAQLKHGSRIHQGTLAELPEPEEGFDVITLLTHLITCQTHIKHSPDAAYCYVPMAVL